MRFAVVDMSDLFHRVTKAVQGDGFTKAGTALHIIFQSLRKLYRQHQVDHIVFCADSRSWRYDIFPQYKAKRRLDRLQQTAKEREEDQLLQETLADLQAFIAERSYCTFLKIEGAEADDLVARFVQLHPNDEHIIMASDSDFIQLLAENVSIYDSMNDRHLRTTGIFDDKGEPMVFEVNSTNGRAKVGLTVEKARAAHEKAERLREREHIKTEKAKAAVFEAHEKQRAATEPGYRAKPYIGLPFADNPFSFEPEAEWWRKALFVKCIRGDSGDGIFSAYPGARYQGSKNKTGILEAWSDRGDKGYHFNNFMLQRWDRVDGQDEKGNTKSTRVTVRESYAFNQTLIDLTMQPEDVKQRMDLAIVEAVQKEPVAAIGVSFLKFCGKHELPRLARDAQDHAAYLAKPYAPKQ